MNEPTPYMKQRFAAMLSGTKPQQEKKAVKMNSSQWYDEKIEESKAKGVCECCGEKLPPSMVINPRSIIAHILPKAKFPAVATASQNCFFACLTCHVLYDQASSDEIEAMPLYPLLRERVATFYNLITEAEKKALPDCFRLDK